MIFFLRPLLALIASLSHQDLARKIVFLREENRDLRSRLQNRVVATSFERSRLLTFGRDFGTKLRRLISIVSYETFRRLITPASRR